MKSNSLWQIKTLIHYPWTERVNLCWIRVRNTTDFSLLRKTIMDELQHFCHLVTAPVHSTKSPKQSHNCWWKDSCFHFPFFSKSPFIQLPFLYPLPPASLFVTGWGSSPLLGRQSLNDFCRFCWAQSSRTWAVWRCPPRPALWCQGGPAPSVCPPSPDCPLWRTWTALWLYWKSEDELLEGLHLQNSQILLKPE